MLWIVLILIGVCLISLQSVLGEDNSISNDYSLFDIFFGDLFDDGEEDAILERLYLIVIFLTIYLAKIYLELVLEQKQLRRKRLRQRLRILKER